MMMMMMMMMVMSCKSAQMGPWRLSYIRGQHQTVNHIGDMCLLDYNHCTILMMTHSTGWKSQRQQLTRKMKRVIVAVIS